MWDTVLKRLLQSTNIQSLIGGQRDDLHGKYTTAVKGSGRIGGDSL